jgi:hypothetical protein
LISSHYNDVLHIAYGSPSRNVRSCFPMRIILRFRNTMQTTTTLKSILMENVDKRVQAFPYAVQFKSSIDEFNSVQAI